MARKSSGTGAKPKAKPSVELSNEEVRGRILEKIRGQDGPVALSVILRGQEKALGRTRAELVEVVEGLAASGVIHRYGTAKTPKFHHEPAAMIVGRSIVAAVSGVGALTWAELKKRPVLKGDAKLVPARQLEEIRDGLVRAGRIYRWPKPTPKGLERFGSSPPDSAEYLSPLLAAFRQQLKALADQLDSDMFSADRLERAAGRALLRLGEAASESGSSADFSVEPVDLGQQILDAMHQLDAATSTGAPVTFERIRPLMSGPLAGKAAFDEAVLRLGTEGRVSLHRHDFPQGQPQSARDQMVPDGRGGYYFTISRRATT